MAGTKKKEGQLSPNWGGARRGSGRKLTSTSDFSIIYQKYLKDYGDPVEAQFRIMKKTEEAVDPVSMKLHLESSKFLVSKNYPNPTETFEDEDGNTIIPVSDARAEVEAYFNSLKEDKE